MKSSLNPPTFISVKGTVNAGKRKYYDAAISNFEQAKRYYEKAGLEPVWLETVEKVMNNHARKYSFMPGFKRAVAGKGL
ncbi:MAG: hypothetical protein PF690_03330 [Deltaproteobacteria bacterium]|nr:hypothetical protein [Deltaproteobacteria bacterium]